MSHKQQRDSAGANQRGELHGLTLKFDKEGGGTLHRAHSLESSQEGGKDGFEAVRRSSPTKKRRDRLLEDFARISAASTFEPPPLPVPALEGKSAFGEEMVARMNHLAQSSGAILGTLRSALLEPTALEDKKARNTMPPEQAFSFIKEFTLLEDHPADRKSFKPHGLPVHRPSDEQTASMSPQKLYSPSKVASKKHAEDDSLLATRKKKKNAHMDVKARIDALLVDRPLSEFGDPILPPLTAIMADIKENDGIPPALIQRLTETLTEVRQGQEINAHFFPPIHSKDVSYLGEARRSHAFPESAVPTAAHRANHLPEFAMREPEDNTDGKWFKPHLDFPATKPAARRDVELLEQWYDAAMKEFRVAASRPATQSQQAAFQEQAIYVQCIAHNEIVRQVYVGCQDRGRMLHKIWQTYLSLTGDLMKKLNEQILCAQKMIERVKAETKEILIEADYQHRRSEDRLRTELHDMRRKLDFYEVGDANMLARVNQFFPHFEFYKDSAVADKLKSLAAAEAAHEEREEAQQFYTPEYHLTNDVDRCLLALGKPSLRNMEAAAQAREDSVRREMSALLERERSDCAEEVISATNRAQETIKMYEEVHALEISRLKKSHARRAEEIRKQKIELESRGLGRVNMHVQVDPLSFASARFDSHLDQTLLDRFSVASNKATATWGSLRTWAVSDCADKSQQTDLSIFGADASNEHEFGYDRSKDVNPSKRPSVFGSSSFLSQSSNSIRTGAGEDLRRSPSRTPSQSYTQSVDETSASKPLAALSRTDSSAKDSDVSLIKAPPSHPPLVIQKLCWTFFVEKIEHDAYQDHVGKQRLRLREYLVLYYMRLYGIREVAERLVLAFIKSLDKWKQFCALAKAVGFFLENDTPAAFRALDHFLKGVAFVERTLTDDTLKSRTAVVVDRFVSTYFDEELCDELVRLSLYSFDDEDLDSSISRTKKMLRMPADDKVKRIDVDDLLYFVITEVTSHNERNINLTAPLFKAIDVKRAGKLSFDQVLYFCRIVKPLNSLPRSALLLANEAVSLSGSDLIRPLVFCNMILMYCFFTAAWELPEVDSEEKIKHMVADKVYELEFDGEGPVHELATAQLEHVRVLLSEEVPAEQLWFSWVYLNHLLQHMSGGSVDPDAPPSPDEPFAVPPPPHRHFTNEAVET